MIYNKQEVLQASTAYFNGNEQTAKIWMNKYALKNEKGEFLELTPLDMHWRLAREFARIEKQFKNPLTVNEILEVLKDFKYIIPQGSPMSGIGNDYQIVSLSNCTLVPPPEDSIGGIWNTDEQLAQLSKRRCGVGVDISTLRPSGTFVSNSAGTTTGTVSFAEQFSNTIKRIGQNGRRGALMISIDVRHPDVIDFINAKLVDGKISGANISVRLDDAFMKQVVNNENTTLFFPVYGDGTVPITIEKEIPARDIWNLIVENSWKSAEPGILFWDTILNNSPARGYWDEGFKESATNPCQPLYAPILTSSGIKKISELKLHDRIWSKEGWTRVINITDSGIRDVYKYKSTYGTIYCTENHKLDTSIGKIEAKDAKDILLCKRSYKDDIDEELNVGKLLRNYQLVMDGLVLGDGSVHKASNNLVYLNVGVNDQDYFDSEIHHLFKKHRPGLKQYAWEIETSIQANELPLLPIRVIPDRLFYNRTRNEICSLLRGIYTANGSITGDRITYKTASPKLAEQIQILLSSIGITSYITVNKAKDVLFKNGTYTCKQSYDINIIRDKEIFYKNIGFIQKYKIEKLKKIIHKTSNNKEILYKDIISKEYIGKEQVVDITVDNESHTYWSGGHSISNCGEIPLCPYDSCRLIAYNLYSYVDNPFTKDAKFNFDKLAKHAKIMGKLADDIVELEIEKIDKILEKINKDSLQEHNTGVEWNLWSYIRETAINGRRCGIGITALGDMLAALGLQYGSKEGNEFAAKVQKFIRNTGMETSINLAKERGHFPIWNYNKDIQSDFINRWIKDKDTTKKVLKDFKKYGKRNIGLFTIAPTGTTSMMCKIGNYFGTTSGIEPVFAISSSRRRKANLDETPTYIDEFGEKWIEMGTTFHSGFLEWLRITKGDEYERLLLSQLTTKEFNEMIVENSCPYYKATAHDIDPITKVQLQGMLQQYIDHSISCTVNTHKDSTKEQVADILLAAWKEGCKGITVYRDGCRQGIITVDNGKSVPVPVNNTRPEKLECDIHHVVAEGQAWLVIIGKMNNDPYEIFAFKRTDENDGAIMLKKDVVKGYILKGKGTDGKSVYSLETEQVVLHNMGKLYLTGEEQAVTRGYSALLQSGIGINRVVEILRKVPTSHISSMVSVITRVLSTYSGKVVINNEQCPQCGSSLLYMEGCAKCGNPECGYSKCG